MCLNQSVLQDRVDQDIRYDNLYIKSNNSVLFVGHRQAMQTQIRSLRFCQNLNTNEEYHPVTLKTEMDWTN